MWRRQIATLKRQSSTIQQQPATSSATSPTPRLSLADIRTSIRPALQPRSLRVIRKPAPASTETSSSISTAPFDPVVDKKDFLYAKDGSFNPEYGFMNALEIGSPLDIYKTYTIVQKNGQAAINRIPEKSFIDLLQRCAKGHFGFLKGFTLFKFASQVRADYMARQVDGEVFSASPDIDAMVVECASFIPAESLDRVVQFVASNHPISSSTAKLHPGLYASLIKVLGMGGRIEAAEELYFKLASMQGVDLSLPSLALCKIYCNAGQMSKAEELYNGLKENGISFHTPSYCVALIRGWAKVGDLQQTRKYFNQFTLKDEQHLRTIAFAALIQCYAVRGLPGDAGFAYKDLRDQGLPASPSIFESMIRSFIPIKDITGANRWFQKIMGAKLLRPSMGMYEALTRAQLAGGESLVAWKTFAKSLTAFKYIRSKSSRVHISFSMAETLVEDVRGKHIDYLRDHMRLAFVPVAHRGEVLAKFMYAALNHSSAPADAKLALSFYNEFYEKDGCASEAGITIMAHINAIKAHGMDGNLKAAQKVFDSIIDTSFDREVEAYNVLIQAYARAGDFVNAEKYLAEFKGHGLKPTVATYESMLLIASAQTDQLEKQKEIKRLAEEIDSVGCVVSPSSHPLVSSALLDNGFSFLPSKLSAA